MFKLLRCRAGILLTALAGTWLTACGCGSSGGLVGTWKSRAGVTITLDEQGQVSVVEGEPPAFLADLGDECHWRAQDGELRFSGTGPDGDETVNAFQYSLTEGGKALHILTPAGQHKGRTIPVSWSFYRQ